MCYLLCFPSPIYEFKRLVPKFLIPMKPCQSANFEICCRHWWSSWSHNHRLNKFNKWKRRSCDNWPISSSMTTFNFNITSRVQCSRYIKIFMCFFCKNEPMISHVKSNLTNPEPRNQVCVYLWLKHISYSGKWEITG